MITSPWPMPIAVGALIGAGLLLLVIGNRFARVVDVLADRTGLGEAIAGALLLGVTTSLPGLITTVLSAAGGNASLAVSNALGGIAAQTMFIALADLTYRGGNLEHAAASMPNVIQALALIAMASLVFLGVTAPALHLGGVHGVTPLLLVTYIYGLHLARKSRASPMWWPQRTPQTRLDEPAPEPEDVDDKTLWSRFAVMAALVAAAGFVVGQAGLSIVATTGLKGSVVGGLFTSLVTSLPELVTVFAAVRIGALTLAVGDIVGGNSFDVLFIFVADLVYTEGPIYGAVDAGTRFLLGLALWMTSLLAAGLVHRDVRGIGFEGVLLLGSFLIGACVLPFL